MHAPVSPSPRRWCATTALVIASMARRLGRGGSRWLFPGPKALRLWSPAAARGRCITSPPWPILEPDRFAMPSARATASWSSTSAGVIKPTDVIVVAGDNITLAGQSAPGDGITIYGRETSFSSRSNIIVRYVRFRQGMTDSSGSAKKTVNITDGTNMIFDHVAVPMGTLGQLRHHRYQQHRDPAELDHRRGRASAKFRLHHRWRAGHHHRPQPMDRQPRAQPQVQSERRVHQQRRL